MIIQPELEYSHYGYMIVPILSTGSWEIFFTVNHEPYENYSSCDKDYLIKLGEYWSNHGVVYIDDID